MTARRFQVDAKTVRRRRDRYLVEGDPGLLERSSRPHHSPNRTRAKLRTEVLRLRRRHRWWADHIAHQTGLAASVQSILTAEGVGPLEGGDRAPEPPKRYERQQPGELIHVDVNKIGGIPDGAGGRVNGRGPGPTGGHAGVGCRYIHSPLDDRTRLVYSEIHHDEIADTACAFWQRAAAWFADHRVHCEGVLTANGSCHKRKWAAACAATSTTVKPPELDERHAALLDQAAHETSGHPPRRGARPSMSSNGSTAGPFPRSPAATPMPPKAPPAGRRGQGSTAVATPPSEAPARRGTSLVHRQSKRPFL